MLEKILSKIASQMREEENVVEVRVGRMSKELREEFDKNNETHEAEHREMKRKIDAFIEKITSEHNCEKFQDVHMDIWEKVYDEIGLTQAERGKKYKMKDRIVYRLDEVDEDEETDSIKMPTRFQ